MPIDYALLRNWRFDRVDQHYDERETMLYALALNVGNDPLDLDQLAFVTEPQLKALPTMAAILARVGSWMRNPATGIDYSRILVGEVSLVLHAPLPIAGHLHAHHEVVSIVDKGEGRGALLTVRKQLFDGDTRIATFDQLTFCRSEGGFSQTGPSDPPAPLEPWNTDGLEPAAPPCAMPTLPQQALLYRLLGDANPLHAIPEKAAAAGFQRPILHGLASFGIVGHALLKTFCAYDPTRLQSIRCRFSAPVFPGETIVVNTWRLGDEILFEAHAGDPGRKVLSNGVARIQP